MAPELATDESFAHLTEEEASLLLFPSPLFFKPEVAGRGEPEMEGLAGEPEMEVCCWSLACLSRISASRFSAGEILGFAAAVG